MDMKFNVEEFKNYLNSKDSFGDAVHFLTEENIIKANEVEDDQDEEND